MPNWSVKIVADTVTPKLAAFAGRIDLTNSTPIIIDGATVARVMEKRLIQNALARGGRYC